MEENREDRAVMKDTAQRAFELLIKNRITENDLVTAYGFGRGTIAGWKSGGDLSMQKVREICVIVNISVSEFFSSEVFSDIPETREERMKLLKQMIDDLNDKQVEVAIRYMRDMMRES